MWKVRIFAAIFLIAGVLVGYFDYTSQTNADSRFPLRLGLDLSGGSHLLYSADVSEIPQTERDESMSALRDVIERRVNLFGVSEPVVQVERAGSLAEERRLIVELPGVTDLDAAIDTIGATPLLEFKLERPQAEVGSILEELSGEEDPVRAAELAAQLYEDTGLTGRFLNRARLEFGSTAGGQGALSNEPLILLEFNDEGREILKVITEENIGEPLVIFLDGNLVTRAVIQTAIPDGTAQISGSMTPGEAREIVKELNLGALPVPIELLSTQTIGPSLGKEAFDAGVRAGIYGLALVALFLIVWYRLPGLLATVALAIYMALMLALFKLIPVTLTAAGIAGFILSIGMAVDANILIFERMKEELKTGKTTRAALREGFARAWLSIRDGNISSLITAVILFWFGTSLVEGFALTFGIGVLISMISAITITRLFVFSLTKDSDGRLVGALFGTGLK